jgi:UDP-glucuronate 4-epimerase
MPRSTKKTCLVTGSAGFIGFHLSQKLLDEGYAVVGVDNLNDYYSVDLKEARNRVLLAREGYTFHKEALQNQDFLHKLFREHEFADVFHLAAQAGVRYSLEKPHVYLGSNVDGTLHVMEAARHARIKPRLMLASSSSVYGLSKALPFRENDPADCPTSLYGATKRANELMGHVYAHLFGLRVTMLRFFTVYGPWGRPDMALFKFVKAVDEGDSIELYNHGNMVRDFTYVDDIVEGIWRLHGVRGTEGLPDYDVFNIGCGHPRTLGEFVAAIEGALGKRAKVEHRPFQPGDVHQTSADISKIRAACGYEPRTSVERGVARYVEWYKRQYG